MRVYATDVATNTQAVATTQTFTYDNTAPTQSLSLTSTTSSFLSGTNLYWNGNNVLTGGFKVVDAVTDAGTGPASATFPDIATLGWTHAAEIVTSGTGGPTTDHLHLEPVQLERQRLEPGRPDDHRQGRRRQPGHDDAPLRRRHDSRRQAAR